MARLPPAARQRLEQCLAEAASAGDTAERWQLLEDAHVLSQPSGLQHVRVHYRMLIAGVRDHDRTEVSGQLTRLVVAAPGSWTCRYPPGNTGRARVRATAPMPIRPDLQQLLEPAP
jgi:hypothetical protein